MLREALADYLFFIIKFHLTTDTAGTREAECECLMMMSKQGKRRASEEAVFLRFSSSTSYAQDEKGDGEEPLLAAELNDRDRPPSGNDGKR